MTYSSKLSRARILAIAIAVILVGVSTGQVFAGHNGAVVDSETLTCGETTFTATIADPNGTHKVSNMYLVVDTEDGDAQFANVPTDGSSVSITVGPFYTSGVENKTVSWHVFGGGERSYDQPLWNGFGTPTFGADIGAYAAEVGSFSWVIAGTDDANPFVTWNEIEVPSCAITKDLCKKGGWADFGFKNQGQCIRFANTGKDSR